MLYMSGTPLTCLVHPLDAVLQSCVMLHVLQIPLHPGALPQPTPDGSSNKPPPLLPWLRAEAESDREVMEKATRAFVSFVRGYKEHHCKFIFRIQVCAGLLLGLCW